MSLITERYADKIAGVLGCFDRVIITGTLPTLCYADGMTRYLSARRIRIFDFAEWAKPPEGSSSDERNFRRQEYRRHTPNLQRIHETPRNHGSPPILGVKLV